VPERPIGGGNRLSNNVAEPEEDVAEVVAPTPRPQVRAVPEQAAAPVAAPEPARTTKPRQRRQSAGGTATVYVSQNVKTRLEDYRIKERMTNRDIILTAIGQLHDQLAGIIEAAKESTAPPNPLFPPDPKAVKYVGGGPVPVQFTPSAAQAEVVDSLSEKLGFTSRSTWIAPVLNEFLPGRKDKPAKGR
jgi:hypothetical protein